MRDLVYIVTAGLNDRPVGLRMSLDLALDLCADRYYPDEILLHIVEIKVMAGDAQVDVYSPMDVYQMLKESGRYY